MYESYSYSARVRVRQSRTSHDVPGFDLESNGGEMITSDDMKDQGLKLQLVTLVLSIIRQS